VAYSAATAMSFSCVLGAGAMPVRAAEWSLQPLFSLTVDQDSNQALIADARPSHGGTLLADLQFRRSLEATEWRLEPKVTVYRYSDPTLGNGVDGSLTAGLKHSGELFGLDLSMLAEDVSTLTENILETGIVEGHTRRHTVQGALNWTWTQTEKAQLVVQASDADVSFTGQDAAALPGYRYPNGSLGERFTLSDRSSITLSVFGNEFLSDTRENSSRQEGVRLEYNRSVSELTLVDAWVDVSDRTIAGLSSRGTDESLTLSRTLERGSLSLSYMHSLAPYGTGFLVEQQQATASALRNVTPYIDADLALVYLKNSEAATLLGIARQRYENAAAGLTWRTGEHWSLRAQLSGGRCSLPLSDELVSEWRFQLTLTWKPQPRVVSR